MIHEFAYTFDNLAGVVEEFTAMLGRRNMNGPPKLTTA